MFWGPTVAGIVFGIYTIWHAPTRSWFLVYVLIVVFLTGYYLWRENHLRLQKNLCVTRILSHTWPIPDGNHIGTQYYMEIVNESEALTIHNIRVRLDSVEPPDANIKLPVTLHQQHDDPTTGTLLFLYSRTFRHLSYDQN